MPKHRTLELSEHQRQELVRYRDHDRRPYLRERAAALLKIADGKKAAEVARRLLLRRHKPDTIYAWQDRYEQGGIDGLLIRKGRGRKTAFSPRHQEPEAAKEEMLHLVRRDPHQLGVPASHWTLQTLQPQLPWLRTQTRAGLWQVLERLGIQYKRAREHVHSPDLAYQAKLDAILALQQSVQESQGSRSCSIKTN